MRKTTPTETETNDQGRATPPEEVGARPWQTKQPLSDGLFALKGVPPGWDIEFYYTEDNQPAGRMFNPVTRQARPLPPGLTQAVRDFGNKPASKSKGKGKELT